jgi:hypothetical protein
VADIEVNSTRAYNALVHDNRREEQNIDDQLEFAVPRVGIFLTQDDEKLPVFAPVGEAEKVLSRKTTRGHNSGARIVLTKDNFGSRATGLGGAGGTKCEAIDIVAGSLSCEDKVLTSDIRSRANFASDGARIYLTERGDINHYFATEAGDKVTTVSSNLKSGIGIKADHTLVIGRERVRILAGLGKFQGGERLVNGPTGGEFNPKIEIGSIVENDYQPAVRGGNLVKYLKEVDKQLSTLAKKVIDLETKLIEYQFAMAFHEHVGGGLGVVVVGPSITAGTSAMKSVPDFMNTTTSAIVDEYNRSLEGYFAMGIPDSGVKGSKEDFILSNTVFIGR